jgi:ABC-type dipeptide/oligopeptide/nickel transport system ATPase component
MTSTSNPILVVKDLRVSFHAGPSPQVAVDGVSFPLCEREVVGVLGESGSGKTTVGSAILGLLPPDGNITGGSINFAGQELIGLSEARMRSIRGAAISLISQEPRIALNPVMKVGTQVAEVIRAHESSNSSQCGDKAVALLNEVLLDGEKVYHAFPHELSGGQCQRVAIAQAIACKPQLVIADEPTSSLDATVQAEILDLLSGLRDRFNTAFLLITHNPVIVAKYADRVLVMNKGCIVEQGTVAEVLRRPTHPYTKHLLQSRKRLLASARAGL